MFHLKLKDTLKHSIATVTSHMDSFVYNPGRDYSRIRKLSPDHVISFLISQGASSTKCEFLDFFQMSEDLPSISALNQRRSQMMPEALEAVFHEFTSSSSLNFQSRNSSINTLLLMVLLLLFSAFQSIRLMIILSQKDILPPAFTAYTLMPFMT